MIKLWTTNIWWGNNTFIKPDLESWSKLVLKDFTTLQANIIWTSYNRGHIQLKTENGLYTYLEDAGRYYFLYPNQTLSKTKRVVVYEVVPDVWANKILNKPFDGVLITTSKEQEILDNDNLLKPINSYFKPETIERKGTLDLVDQLSYGSIYKVTTQWTTKYQTYDFQGSILTAKTGFKDVNSIPKDQLKKFKNLSTSAYKMIRWIDGTALPSEFKDFYSIGKKVIGITENIPKELGTGQLYSLAYLNFQKFSTNAQPKYISIPIIGNGLNFELTNYTPYSDITLAQTIPLNKPIFIPSPQRSDNDLNYLVFGVEKELTQTIELSKQVVSGTTHSTNFGDIDHYTTEKQTYKSYSENIRGKWDFDFEGSFIKKDGNNWNINLWEFFSPLKDNEYLLDVTKKVLITKDNIYVDKTILNFNNTEKDNKITLNSNNERKHIIMFRDGETVELPYGESVITYNNKIYENGSVLTLNVENERLTKKWIKTTKETTNFLDNSLKYLQMQQLNRNYDLALYKNEVENKRANFNLVSNIIGGFFGFAGSGALFKNALGQNNYSGITSSVGSAVSSISSIANSIVNYKYDNEIRKREFENSLFEFNVNKQTLERQLIKLDTSINFVSDWKTLLDEENLGDDGFVVIVQTASEHTKNIYNLYLNNVGFPTNTYILKEHKLKDKGIYQFGFFIETDPEDGEDIKTILTNPIKIISTE